MYKSRNGTLCNTINRIPSDPGYFLHHNMVHPKSFEDSMSLRQALWKNQIALKQK